MDAPRKFNFPLELWGGVECSMVRIGDSYRDQLAETGHSARPADLEAIAGLGIGTVRYPILWESVAPDSPDDLDFGWHDERLGRLRELGIKVIAGLVHHGSGPRYTNLLDPAFAQKLGDYAARVARRYPWIERWTPVNEPLTTARFSCLYGHWYPHRKDWNAFLAALVNQCSASLCAIRAIRSVIPSALHMPTEDLGKTFSTSALAYQARHENLRRWLSLDLLAGRVDRSHPSRKWLEDAGVDKTTLDDFLSLDAAPDIIGINHYLTSERYLDHRAELYPGEPAGTNGADHYVDVEAVRIPRLATRTGLGERLLEAWQRYSIPLAVTEVHHGCTREEQVRWLGEAWQSARTLRAGGVDIRAITLWSLFGNVDWRSLLTRKDGIYDVGAFDVRGGTPRPTMLAHAAKAIAGGGDFAHPAPDGRPWWRRPERFYSTPKLSRPDRSPRRPLLITGSTGTLGRAFARICERRGLAFLLTDRRRLEITDPASIEAILDEVRPWAVINTAGFVRVAEAEAQPDDCFSANADGPELLASACRRHGLPLVTFSSDLVFDGTLGRPYIEPDATAPASVYGRSKAEAEQRVLAVHGDTLVVRTSAFFGPWDRHNFLASSLGRLARGEQVAASGSTIVSPTYVPDLVHATLDLLLDGESGLWHLANQGSISWHGLACAVADRGGLGRAGITDSGGPGADTSLASERGALLRPLDQALDDFMRHSEHLPA